MQHCDIECFLIKNSKVNKKVRGDMHQSAPVALGIIKRTARQPVSLYYY